MRRSHPIPGDDLQDDVIDAPDGEELMPVTTIASMPYGLATIWGRWATRLIVVVKVHLEVTGVAASSAS